MKNPLRRGFSIDLILLLAFSILLFPSRAFAAANPLSLDIAVQGIQQAQPPRLISDVVIFSYRSDQPVRFVGARFAHEGYAILHPYSRNENGAFVLDYTLPEGVREIRYRIVVDGLWMADPSNPAVENDELGNPISVFRIDKEPARAVMNPKREADGRLTFIFHGRAGRRVSLVGDFNDWDPFIDYLSEEQPGVYLITIRVEPGRHFYYFFSDGLRIPDINNQETATDPDGDTVSYFFLPS